MTFENIKKVDGKVESINVCDENGFITVSIKDNRLSIKVCDNDHNVVAYSLDDEGTGMLLDGLFVIKGER